MGGGGRSPAGASKCADEILEELNEAEKDGPRVYALSDKVVSGKLDLSNRTIKVALKFQRCHFEREVDLSYCEFEQTADFSDCTFHRDLIAGDEDRSHTVFKKDLICNRAVFKKAARFRGVRCDGKALLRGAHLQIDDGEADFGGARFEQALDFGGAEFHRSVDFGLVRCGFASFDEARFHNKAMLVDFSGASFKHLSCSDARFKGPVSFNGAECTGIASFTKTKFQGKTEPADDAHRLAFAPPPADFGAASFNYLDCSGTIFRGPVSFNGMECKADASFREAKFLERTRRLSWADEVSVDFTAATLRYLDCSWAEFNGPASFYRATCAVSASFRGACFNDEINEVNFAVASFNYLDCSEVKFHGRANFNGLKCADGASFGGAAFVRRFLKERSCLFPRSEDFAQKGVDFSFAHFGSNLDLALGRFERGVRLEEAKISGKLDLTEAQFIDAASFYGATIGRLVFEQPAFGQSLDLRECTFEWFRATDTKKEANRLVSAQDPFTFSSDPYVQLENYYNKVGDRHEANEMYRAGRAARLKNANDRHGSTTWSWKQKLGDRLLRELTGYGVQTERLFLIALAVFLLGFLIFLPNDALVPVDASGPSAAAGRLLASTVYTEGQDSYGLGEKIWDRATYSLDLFLPVVKLGVDEQWEPSGFVPRMYAFVHQFVGWLVVPLLLASLAGIIKRPS